MGALIERRKSEWDSMMKSAISEAAISVLNEYGFDGLRMDRVANAAEVAKGTLYNYFRNKDELLINVIDMKFASIHQALLEIYDNKMSPPDKMEEIIRALLTFLEDERGLVLVVIDAEGLSVSVKDSATVKREIVIKLIAGIIEAGIEKGYFRKFDAIQAAKLIHGAIHASFQIKIRSKDDHRSDEESVSDLIKLFFSGLLSKE